MAFLSESVTFAFLCETDNIYSILLHAEFVFAVYMADFGRIRTSF